MASVKIEQEVLDARLTPFELAVYAHLKRFVGRGGGTFPTHETLAEYACMSSLQVDKSLKSLKKKGFIRIEGDSDIEK